MSSTKGRKKVTLSCYAGNDSKVFVAGTFNGWDPSAKPMKPTKEGELHQAVLMLHPGQYEYKFVIDEDWIVDGNNPQWTPNDLGSLNSLINVK